MTESQWDSLLKVVNGELSESKLIGFIIDSPWLPGWYGVSTLDYYSNDDIWFEANKTAIEKFPDAMFLPGFWSEYGMCTEPSAFGAKSIWQEVNLPHAEKVINDISQINEIVKPNPVSDGLLPFMINRLKIMQPRIESIGHSIRFAVARGPLNIASFLMGTTELMMGIAMQPETIHKLLNVITDFTTDWLDIQFRNFKTIDGILILDDLVGFLGEPDFKTFALPYLKKIYDQFDVSVKFFHNDAPGLVCAPFLGEIGINLFNFSHEHSLKQIQQLTDGNVVLLGNIPPRDVMASGSLQEVEESVKNAWNSVDDKSGIIWSCGGGMPMGVKTENIERFIRTIQEGI
ncbi:uroporphyrinogen decarboxylase family protein [Bacteroidota bacterium]